MLQEAPKSVFELYGMPEPGGVQGGADSSIIQATSQFKSNTYIEKCVGLVKEGIKSFSEMLDEIDATILQKEIDIERLKIERVSVKEEIDDLKNKLSKYETAKNDGFASSELEYEFSDRKNASTSKGSKAHAIAVSFYLANSENPRAAELTRAEICKLCPYPTELSALSVWISNYNNKKKLHIIEKVDPKDNSHNAKWKLHDKGFRLLQVNGFVFPIE